MRAALAGDELCYRRLLTELAPALRIMTRRAAAQFPAASADIEDIVQETLLAIHLKRHTWKDTEPLGPWIRAIARNKMIDAMRRRGRRGRVDVPLEDFADVLAAPEPEPQLAPGDAEKLLAAINGRQRDVVRAIAVDGLSAGETATQFGMSEGAVRVALHRGLAALAAAFRTDDI